MSAPLSGLSDHGVAHRRHSNTHTPDTDPDTDPVPGPVPRHSPRSGTGTGTVSGTNTAPDTGTAELACRECRRRKSKCDRRIPVCRLCAKFSRGCTYERASRTPLTRTHLNAVEAELERVRGLLRRVMPEQQDQLDLDGRGRSGEEIGEQARSHATVPAVTKNGHHQVHPDIESRSRATDVPLSTPLDTNRQPAPYTNQRRASESRSIGTTAFSLETPPSSSNFEWDERGAAGDKFVDGMASLTSRSNEGGYLGSASGAALLRLTDARDGESTEPHPGSYASAPQYTIPFIFNSQSQLEPFIDAYFQLYHTSYPIVHEATFRAQFMEIIPRPPGATWQVLLFVISALGVFTSSTTPTDIDLALFTAAKERLSIDVLETGNLVLVQALTLISNYLQKRNKPNSGYNYMGLARRVAMGIGLHKEFQAPNSSWDASLLTLEMRRRVWYCLYIFDIGAMITFSRPLDFPNEGVDVHLPMNVHDSDITAQTRIMPAPSPESTIYTHLRAQAKFHLATSHIYSKIISHPLPSAGELLALDDQFIGAWLADLPPYFAESTIQPPKFSLCHAILRWRYRNFRILMYRTFLVGQIMARSQSQNQPPNITSDTAMAIDRCLSAAREAVSLICTFWAVNITQRTSMACWYGLYFLFQAILIPVICLRNDPQSHLAQEWRDQVLQAVEVLESMALLNPTAQRCLSVIQNLCGGYLHPSTLDGGAWGPTEESPQTQLANLYPLMWPLEGDNKSRRLWTL
ncbi:fungal-specific transcription factor domain-containing protein [Aspergillus unguis]